MKAIPTASMADRLRNPLRYSVNPVGVLSDTARTYGDLVRFMPPKSPFDTLMLNRAEWIEEVIETHAWNFSIVRVLSIDKALRQGLLTSRGYLHQRQRELMSAPFHSGVPTAAGAIAPAWGAIAGGVAAGRYLRHARGDVAVDGRRGRRSGLWPGGRERTAGAA